MLRTSVFLCGEAQTRDHHGATYGVRPLQPPAHLCAPVIGERLDHVRLVLPRPLDASAARQPAHARRIVGGATAAVIQVPASDQRAPRQRMPLALIIANPPRRGASAEQPRAAVSASIAFSIFAVHDPSSQLPHLVRDPFRTFGPLARLNSRGRTTFSTSNPHHPRCVMPSASASRCQRNVLQPSRRRGLRLCGRRRSDRRGQELRSRREQYARRQFDCGEVRSGERGIHRGIGPAQRRSPDCGGEQADQRADRELRHLRKPARKCVERLPRFAGPSVSCFKMDRGQPRDLTRRVPALDALYYFRLSQFSFAHVTVTFLVRSFIVAQPSS